MDNNTVADTGIDRVITCGVRWGATANSYADLMTANGVCILASEHGSIELFRSIEKGDLIALKDGRNIIALGKPKLSDEGKTLTKKNIFWLDLFRDTLNLRLSDDQLKEKASHFEFELSDRIDVITIEEWVMLDTPIYYPLVQGTVTIRDEKVKQDCINRFNELDTSTEKHEARQIDYYLKNAQHLFSQYSVMSDDDVKKAALSEELLSSIDIVLNYDPKNEIAKQMKSSIIKGSYLVTAFLKSKNLSTTYNDKAEKLKTNNYFYIIPFIVTLAIFIGYSVYHIKTFDITSIPKDILIVFIVTKGFIASSMILSVFWVARFLNRRIHENVYLIEEYEYKALIFDSLQNLKVVFEKDIPDEVFQNIIEKIIENPAINLLKIKDKKSDETRLTTDDLLKLLKALK